jgi:hypothetical protein
LPLEQLLCMLLCVLLVTASCRCPSRSMQPAVCQAHLSTLAYMCRDAHTLALLQPPAAHCLKAPTFLVCRWPSVQSWHQRQRQAPPALLQVLPLVLPLVRLAPAKQQPAPEQSAWRPGRSPPRRRCLPQRCSKHATTCPQGCEVPCCCALLVAAVASRAYVHWQ